MAGSVNKAILVGNLGRDPEIRLMQEGTKMAMFSVATNETWKDKVTGERKDRTEWHRIVVLNERLADICERFLKKGSRVYVEGQIQTRKWTDNSGHDRYTTEVIVSRFRGDITLLDSKTTFDDHHQSDEPQNPSPTRDKNTDFDDDIPF